MEGEVPNSEPRLELIADDPDDDARPKGLLFLSRVAQWMRSRSPSISAGRAHGSHGRHVSADGTGVLPLRFRPQPGDPTKKRVRECEQYRGDCGVLGNPAAPRYKKVHPMKRPRCTRCARLRAARYDQLRPSIYTLAATHADWGASCLVDVGPHVLSRERFHLRLGQQVILTLSLLLVKETRRAGAANAASRC